MVLILQYCYIAIYMNHVGLIEDINLKFNSTVEIAQNVAEGGIN